MESIKLTNFLCYRESQRIPFSDITILIGENDSGKSAILKALDTFLNNIAIDYKSLFSANDERSQSCEIEISFHSLHVDFPSFPIYFIINNKVIIKKRFVIGGEGQISTEYLIRRYLYTNPELNDIKSLKAEQLKEILPQFGLSYSNVDPSREKLSKYLQENFSIMDKYVDWHPIKFTDISPFLPIYEHYDSTTIINPTRIISNTLESIYRSFFYDYIEGEERLKPNFLSLEAEIRSNLNEKISSELKDRIQEKNHHVTNIIGDYSIDFASGFHLKSLQVDMGHGCRDINSIGEGTRKRLFLTINEWEKDIRRTNNLKKVIRGYDEPDTSLHVTAQKEIYYAIKSLSEDSSVKIQPIICTHSIVMIDRAPPRIINHVKHVNGESFVEYLQSNGDDELRTFLDSLSELSGISTSALFYERCFMIVEGETEYIALPKMYEKIYGKSFLETGVMIINIGGNGAWKNFLKLLNANRKNSTLLVLDSDTQNQTSTKVNKKDLERIGFDDEFLKNNVFFIGNNEFEDIFSPSQVCKCLNQYYKKNGSELWCIEDVESISKEGKFSENLERMVNRYIFESEMHDKRFRKPDFGENISEILEPDEILGMNIIPTIFTKINEITNRIY
jgi:putative ATP-dependent endonuclease of the OLD family